MKRLMLLGGSRYALPVIEAAHNLGVYVITCDYLPDNVAHKYSDQYCNVNIIDKEAVFEAAKELHIDGIMSFACDPGVVTAAFVAEKMGLPSCGSFESVSILQNKARFRRFLQENGFNVPKSRSFKNIEDVICSKLELDYPLIVKPVDSAGSKGVRRVDSISELEAAAEYAFSFSQTHEIIVEDFLQQVGFSSDTDSFSVDGELRFVSFNCQRFDEKAENPYTPAAYSWPSSMPYEAEKELSREIQRVVSLLNLKSSIYNIETRVATNGKPYIMEISPRGGGNRLAECLKYATGIDMIDASVRAALGMEINEIEQKPYNGFWAEVILHSDNEGLFKELWVSEEIEESIIEKDVWVEKGDSICGFDAANKAIGTLILNFDNIDLLEKVMNNIREYIRVIVEDQNI